MMDDDKLVLLIEADASQLPEALGEVQKLFNEFDKVLSESSGKLASAFSAKDMFGQVKAGLNDMFNQMKGTTDEVKRLAKDMGASLEGSFGKMMSGPTGYIKSVATDIQKVMSELGSSTSLKGFNMEPVLKGYEALRVKIQEITQLSSQAAQAGASTEAQQASISNLIRLYAELGTTIDRFQKTGLSVNIADITNAANGIDYLRNAFAGMDKNINVSRETFTAFLERIREIQNLHVKLGIEMPPDIVAKVEEFKQAFQNTNLRVVIDSTEVAKAATEADKMAAGMNNVKSTMPEIMSYYTESAKKIEDVYAKEKQVKELRAASAQDISSMHTNLANMSESTKAVGMSWDMVRKAVTQVAEIEKQLAASKQNLSFDINIDESVRKLDHLKTVMQDTALSLTNAMRVDPGIAVSVEPMIAGLKGASAEITALGGKIDSTIDHIIAKQMEMANTSHLAETAAAGERKKAEALRDGASAYDMASAAAKRYNDGLSDFIAKTNSAAQAASNISVGKNLATGIDEAMRKVNSLVDSIRIASESMNLKFDTSGATMQFEQLNSMVSNFKTQLNEIKFDGLVGDDLAKSTAMVEELKTKIGQFAEYNNQAKASTEGMTASLSQAAAEQGRINGLSREGLNNVSSYVQGLQLIQDGLDRWATLSGQINTTMAEINSKKLSGVVTDDDINKLNQLRMEMEKLAGLFNEAQSQGFKVQGLTEASSQMQVVSHRVAKLTGNMRELGATGTKTLSSLGSGFMTLGNVFRSLSNGMGTIESTIRNLGGMVVGVFASIKAAATGGGLVGSFIDAARQMENYRITLNSVQKDMGATLVTFKQLNEWASKNPVDTDEAVQAFVRLRVAGVKNTMEATKAVGDLATVMQRSMGDVAASLISLEAEPLRRLGIIIDRTGKTALITSGNVRKEVTKDINVIRAAIIETIQEQFGGAMDKAKNTLEGSIKTMRGMWHKFRQDVMGTETDPSGPYKKILDVVIKIRDAWEGWMGSADYYAKIELLRAVFNKLLDIIIKVGTAVKNLFSNYWNDLPSLIDKVVTLGREWGAFVAKVMITQKVLAILGSLTSTVGMVLLTVSQLKMAFGALAPAAGGAASATAGIFAGIKGAFAGVAGVFTGVIAAVKSVGAAISMGFAVGTTTVGSFTSAIAAGASQVATVLLPALLKVVAVIGLFRVATSFFSELLGISSILDTIAKKSAQVKAVFNTLSIKTKLEEIDAGVFAKFEAETSKKLEIIPTMDISQLEEKMAEVKTKMTALASDASALKIYAPELVLDMEAASVEKLKLVGEEITKWKADLAAAEQETGSLGKAWDLLGGQSAKIATYLKAGITKAFEGQDEAVARYSKRIDELNEKLENAGKNSGSFNEMRATIDELYSILGEVGQAANDMEKKALEMVKGRFDKELNLALQTFAQNASNLELEIAFKANLAELQEAQARLSALQGEADKLNLDAFVRDMADVGGNFGVIVDASGSLQNALDTLNLASLDTAINNAAGKLRELATALAGVVKAQNMSDADYKKAVAPLLEAGAALNKLTEGRAAVVKTIGAAEEKNKATVAEIASLTEKIKNGNSANTTYANEIARRAAESAASGGKAEKAANGVNKAMQGIANEMARTHTNGRQFLDTLIKMRDATDPMSKEWAKINKEIASIRDNIQSNLDWQVEFEAKWNDEETRRGAQATVDYLNSLGVNMDFGKSGLDAVDRSIANVKARIAELVQEMKNASGEAVIDIDNVNSEMTGLIDKLTELEGKKLGKPFEEMEKASSKLSDLKQMMDWELPGAAEKYNAAIQENIASLEQMTGMSFDQLLQNYDKLDDKTKKLVQETKNAQKEQEKMADDKAMKQLQNTAKGVEEGFIGAGQAAAQAGQAMGMSARDAVAGWSDLKDSQKEAFEQMQKFTLEKLDTDLDSFFWKWAKGFEQMKGSVGDFTSELESKMEELAQNDKLSPKTMLEGLEKAADKVVEIWNRGDVGGEAMERSLDSLLEKFKHLEQEAPETWEKMKNAIEAAKDKIETFKEKMDNLIPSFQDWEDAFVDFADGVGDALTDWIVKGEDLEKSLEKCVEQLAAFVVKALIMKALAPLFGNLFNPLFSGGTFGSAFGGGGGGGGGGFLSGLFGGGGGNATAQAQQMQTMNNQMQQMNTNMQQMNNTAGQFGNSMAQATAQAGQGMGQLNNQVDQFGQNVQQQTQQAGQGFQNMGQQANQMGGQLNQATAQAGQGFQNLNNQVDQFGNNINQQTQMAGQGFQNMNNQANQFGTNMQQQTQMAGQGLQNMNSQVGQFGQNMQQQTQIAGQGMTSLNSQVNQFGSQMGQATQQANTGLQSMNGQINQFGQNMQQQTQMATQGLNNVTTEAQQMAPAINQATQQAGQGFENLNMQTSQFGQNLNNATQQAGMGFQNLNTQTSQFGQNFTAQSQMVNQNLMGMNNNIQQAGQGFQNMGSQANMSLNQLNSTVPNINSQMGQLGQSAQMAGQSFNQMGQTGVSSMNQMASSIPPVNNGLQQMQQQVPQIEQNFNQLGSSATQALTSVDSQISETGAGITGLGGIFQSVFGLIGGLFKGIGGLFKGLFGGLFGGLGFAKGGVFSNGHVSLFARGGIVNGPTAFPMKSGVGVMGEKGKEAVMPLSRTSDGELGISIADSMPTSTIINVLDPGEVQMLAMQAVASDPGTKIIYNNISMLQREGISGAYKGGLRR